MKVQIALGADVMMVFDECAEHPASYERTRESMGLTHAWAARSKEYFEAHKQEVPWFGDPTHHDEAVMNGALILLALARGIESARFRLAGSGLGRFRLRGLV